jgi:carboxyl-terminal processing protease
MLKRILTIAGGMLLGSVLAVGTAQIAGRQGWWPGGDAGRSAAYVREVLQLVNDQYVEPDRVMLDDLTKSALKGIVSALDPHSAFLDARHYEVLREEMQSQFGGIGVQVEMQENSVVVIAPIVGTPGERAGVQRGDRIVRVDGEEVGNTSMDQVVRKLRGKPGTTVRVGFFRPGTGREFTAEITREVIRVESVREVKLLPDGVGYVQLTQFAERTGREVREAIERLKDEGMQALVLDLRNNPGGLLTTAVEVAEAFFPRGELIVYTQGRNERDREEFRSTLRGHPVDVPVAVLINSGSASAAEIVAGALKDTHRAVIVGERSFGKGSVQSIFRLKDGEALRLTTARYFTPSGVTIHEQGVTPDVELVMTPEEDRQLARQRARADLAGDPELYRQRFGVDPVIDRQLEAALEVLRAARLLDERGERPRHLTAAR